MIHNSKLLWIIFVYEVMPMVQVKVALKRDELDALFALSEKERRDPRAQAAMLIRQSLERLGLIHPAPKQEAGNGSKSDH